MSGYTKLFERILDSTIWREEDPTRILWIAMLALADQDGIVSCTIPGLADRARISLEQCERALTKFQQPDKYSWSQEKEGRRIEPVNGGWKLINHSKFRALMSAEEQREKTRIRVAKWREQQKKVTVTKSNAGNDKQKQKQKQIQKQESKAYNPPVTKQETIPENLHPINYATKILEDIAFPHTQDNLRIVSAAIEAEIKSGKTGPAAYEFIRAGTLDARDEGIPINRFFFADAKYRLENRKARTNGNGSHFETIADRNKRVMEEYEQSRQQEIERSSEPNRDDVRTSAPKRRI